MGPQGFEPSQVVSFGSRSAIYPSLVNGEYHWLTGFMPDRWCMYVVETNGTKRRITGKSVARVKLRFNAPPWYLGNGRTEFPGDSGSRTSARAYPFPRTLRRGFPRSLNLGADGGVAVL